MKQAIHQNYYKKSEAVTQQSSLKIMFCKTSQISQESIWDGATFNKGVSPHTRNCNKKTPSLPFSSAYTYFNMFALCFISIKPSIFQFKSFGFKTDQYLFNSPSYFNSKMLKILNKANVNY